MNKSVCDLTTGIVSIVELTQIEEQERQTTIKAIENLNLSQLPFRIRTERNAKIAACDWRMLTDSPGSAGWKVYRQALRDVPLQAGFPENVVWPVAP